MSPLARETLTLFANLIEKERRKRKMSQVEFAKRCGIGRTTAQNMLKGSPAISIGHYFEAAVLLGIPLFTESKSELKRLSAQTEEVLSLLPKKAMQEKVELDDNF